MRAILWWTLAENGVKTLFFFHNQNTQIQWFRRSCVAQSIYGWDAGGAINTWMAMTRNARGCRRQRWRWRRRRRREGCQWCFWDIYIWQCVFRLCKLVSNSSLNNCEMEGTRIYGYCFQWAVGKLFFCFFQSAPRNWRDRLFGTQANGTHLANISNGGRKGRLGAPTETFRGAAGESKFSDAANWPIYSIDIYIYKHTMEYGNVRYIKLCALADFLADRHAPRDHVWMTPRDQEIKTT